MLRLQVFTKCAKTSKASRKDVTKSRGTPTNVLLFYHLRRHGRSPRKPTTKLSTWWIGLAMEEATEGIQKLASSVSSPLTSFVGSLNASTEEVELLLSSTREWLGELESGMLLRLDAFDTAHRQAARKRSTACARNTRVVLGPPACLPACLLAGSLLALKAAAGRCVACILHASRDQFLGRGPEFDLLAEGVELASADFVLEAVGDVSALMRVLQVYEGR